MLPMETTLTRKSLSLHLGHGKVYSDSPCCSGSSQAAPLKSLEILLTPALQLLFPGLSTVSKIHPSSPLQIEGKKHFFC